MGDRGPRRVLAVPEQYARMAASLPQFRVVKRAGGTIWWEGDLQPTPLSDRYTVRIAYSPPDWPKVSVVEPKLTRRAPDEIIPHMYEDDTLCLYLPFGHEWTPAESVARIVPWTSLWLAHYEAWHATGEWLGGGAHPAPPLPRRIR